MAVFAIATFLMFGFILARGAPGDLRWMAWLLIASFVFPFSFLALLIGRRLRQGQLSTPQSSAPLRPRPRAKICLVLTIVTAVSAIEQARINSARHLFRATTGEIFFWNFAALAVLIAIVELSEWRKRPIPNTVRRPG